MKKHTKLDAQWFYNIIAQGEGQLVDFKEAMQNRMMFGKSQKNFSSSYTELAKDVIAFANRKGGFILIGIIDETKEINANFKLSNQKQIDLIKNIQSRTVPSITIITHPLRIRGTDILVVEIPFSRQLHCTTKGEYLIRNWDGNKAILPHEMAVVMSEKNLLIYDQKDWHLRYDWEDISLTRELYRRIKDNNPKSPFLKQSQQEFNETLGIIQENNQIFSPTTTGLLFIGNNRALKELPYNEIKYIRYKNDGSYTPYEYKGNLIELADKTFTQLKSEINTEEIQFGLFRYYIEDYPEIVIRELIMNAIIHRDYSRHQIIEIRKYEDYIEFESPGVFPEGITVENCLRKTNARNPNIMDIFREIGYAEKAGSGFDKIFRSLLLKGKALPEIEETDSSLIVRVKATSIEKGLIQLSQEYKELKGIDIELNKILVLNYIIKNKKASLRDLENTPYLEKNSLKRILKDLQDIEFIESTGRTSDLKYIVHKSKLIGIEDEKSYLQSKKIAQQKQIESILRYLEEFHEITNAKARDLLNIPDSNAGHISRLFSKMIEKELIYIIREEGHNRRVYSLK